MWGWPLGIGLFVSGIALYVSALRLPRASGTPLLVLGTILGSAGAVILLMCLAAYVFIRALGFH